MLKRRVRIHESNNSADPRFTEDCPVRGTPTAAGKSEEPWGGRNNETMTEELRDSPFLSPCHGQEEGKKI